MALLRRARPLGSGSIDIACHDLRKTITMDEIYEDVTLS